MKHVHSIVKQPLITEKSTIRKEATGVYCFRTHARANKIEIARAVEALFGVKVAEVRTSIVRGKTRQMGKFFGQRPNWKKAWVRLAPGEKDIEYFEAS